MQFNVPKGQSLQAACRQRVHQFIQGYLEYKDIFHGKNVNATYVKGTYDQGRKIYIEF